jgi:hypothetical protein
MTIGLLGLIFIILFLFFGHRIRCRGRADKPNGAGEEEDVKKWGMEWSLEWSLESRFA